MKNSNDKLVSLIMLCVTVILLIFTDLILIIYVFSCLQLAGISEFKQRQDYLVVALISLIFTPIGLLFIKEEKNDGP